MEHENCPRSETLKAVSSSEVLAGCQRDARRARAARADREEACDVRAMGASTGSGTRTSGLRPANGMTPSHEAQAPVYPVVSVTGVEVPKMPT